MDHFAKAAKSHINVFGHRSYICEIWSLREEEIVSENLSKLIKTPRVFELPLEMERDLTSILFRSQGGRNIKKLVGDERQK